MIIMGRLGSSGEDVERNLRTWRRTSREKFSRRLIRFDPHSMGKSNCPLCGGDKECGSGATVHRALISVSPHLFPGIASLRDEREKSCGASWRAVYFLAVNLIACLLNEAKFVLIN